MDDDGFREFVQVRYMGLLRTAYLLTGSRDAAQDLVQNALVKVMSRWSRVDDPMAYLRRTMVNERTARWRRIGSREILTAFVPERWRPDPANTVVERDELLSALGQLPARMRAVLVLRYWEDLSEADTAAILGCSVGTVKSQAARGLAKLRVLLAPATTAHQVGEAIRGGKA
ncbi:SigE family RNA polymerase sigma factor [Asanoa siamensis]|uniref:DNA-directed RNA polymerase sigma-70 factor n=1 Tax=Asanoa siamensis TaxID=926357 RepID=A0ABQ4D0D0_9ACTN|nr:SigE family RNA polymerase sigma factor [Asanoa siamensis]GIF76983.1 DNA-directed RNA polymerase sigma-70 factor [Asanoa siamensis]